MIVPVDKTNIEDMRRLQDFTELLKTDTFRYFYTRTAYNAVVTHLLTILYIDNNIPCGYAHIDYDDAHKKHFVGLCVLPAYQGRGIGRKLLEFVIEHANARYITLYLTVDKLNNIAIELYKKCGFIICETFETYFMMKHSSDFREKMYTASHSPFHK